MVKRQDKLVNAYMEYSRDIGENMDRFEVIYRVEHLVKTNKLLYEDEIARMKDKGYWK